MIDLNILYMNFSKAQDIFLTTTLQDLSKKLYMADDITSALEKIETIKPEIIIFKASLKESGSDDFWDSIKQINSLSSTPSMLIILPNKKEFFFKAVSSGIDYTLVLPCSRKHLACQIIETAKKGKITFQSLSKLPDSCHLLSNTLENSIHQGILLNEQTKKNRKLSTQLKKIKKSGLIRTTTKKNQMLEKEIWNALDNSQFRLFYQPVISIAENRLSGFESLIRWIHPDKGIIPPDDFIPLAEQSDVIMPMGFWIIEEAARQMREWQNKFQLNTPFRINVNLSPKQFTNTNLSSRILEIMDFYEIDNENIVFEITESAFMEDIESANIMLLELKARGFSIYMDDFGTGYSSLTYLLHFPVDCIKIDKSFVQWMHIEEQNKQIVKSVTDLAHNLNIKVVAEGIESEEHLDIIKKIGCDYGQGYYYSKPVPCVEAEEYIKKYFSESNN